MSQDIDSCPQCGADDYETHRPHWADGVAPFKPFCECRCGATWDEDQPIALPAPLAVMKPHKENPYYPATYIGEGWQDGFDGKALASTLEPYTRGYAEGKADAHAIKQTQGITKGQP
jgi:hypothetical protein